MTTVKLIKIPTNWDIKDEDGDKLTDNFSIGMILDVSVKSSTHVRCYEPVDVNIPIDCVQYIDGDKFI
jgi:hypothetical protein